MNKIKTIFAAVLLSAGSAMSVSAQVPSSSSYSVQESGFSSGSGIDSNSASYNSRGSAGNLGIGTGESASFLTFAGFITPDEEYIELVIPVTTVDMGIIEPGTPGTGTATFSARAYINDEYVIVSPRDSPTLSGGTETIDPITTATTFNSAVEQFGMNLVANTAPVAQGAAPAPQPDGSFAYGQAAPGYDTADNYQYNAGDVLAESVTKGFGETNFTISYLLNITTITPAGQYIMEQDLVMFATF